MSEGPDLSNYELLLLVADYPIMQLPHFEKDIGQMTF
jgi:hypothetical protein